MQDRLACGNHIGLGGYGGRDQYAMHVQVACSMLSCRVCGLQTGKTRSLIGFDEILAI